MPHDAIDAILKGEKGVSYKTVERVLVALGMYVGSTHADGTSKVETRNDKARPARSRNKAALAASIASFADRNDERLTQAEIGQTVGASQASVSNYINRAYGALDHRRVDKRRRRSARV